MSDWQMDSASRPSAGKSGSIAGMIVLMLFAAPFAGFGAFALVQGVRKMAGGDVKNGVALCVFGLIFSAVGFGLGFGAFWARQKAKNAADLQARNPGQPWLLRPDWAAGKIKSSANGQSIVYLFMAVAFCGIGGLSAVAALPRELSRHNYAVLLVLAFPVVGIVFLVAFARAWLARRRYGDCVLELAQVPIPLGGTLAGMIQTGTRLKPEHGLQLKLSCTRRSVYGSGKNRSAHENVLWQDEKILKPQADLPEPEPGQTGIPVFFTLPPDQPQSSSGGDVSVLWRLEARAKMAGPNFIALFEVPVFQIAGCPARAPQPPDPTADAGNPTAVGDPDPTAALQMPVEELRRDEHSRIQVGDGPGGREFSFPAARNPGSASGLTLFFIVWTGLFYVLLKHAPLIFPIFWGITDVFVAYQCLVSWFRSSRVTIDGDGASIVTRCLFFRRRRQFAAGEIARFEISTGMSAGSRVYSDIRLVPRDYASASDGQTANTLPPGAPPPRRYLIRDDRGILVASRIASVSEAKWLAQQMNRALADHRAPHPAGFGG